MNILMVILPGIFLLFGVYGIIKTIIDKKKCTEYVEATVVDIDVSSDSEGRTSYHPVFGYRFEGVDYRRRSSFSSSFCRFHVGDQVDLYIAPDKPEEFRCPKETVHRVIFYLLFSFVGAGLMLIFMFKK